MQQQRFDALTGLKGLFSLLINTVQFGASAVNIRRILFTVLLQNGGGLSTDYPYNGPSWFISALSHRILEEKNSEKLYMHNLCERKWGAVQCYSILWNF